MTVGDSSGGGNSGTIKGATWTTAGTYGKALLFNGTSSYVDLASPPGLRITPSNKSTVVTPGAGVWSQAAVNGLVARVGYSTDSSPNSYWDSIVLEAAVE